MVKNKTKLIAIIILLIFANIIIYQIREIRKKTNLPNVIKMEYGTVINSKLKNLLSIRTDLQKYIAVILLLHSHVDNIRELIWANLLKNNFENKILTKVIFNKEYELKSKLINNQLKLQIDKDKKIFSMLGNLGNNRYKITIIKNDSIIYNNFIGIDVISEAGEILNRICKEKIINEKINDSFIYELRGTRKLPFSQLLDNKNYENYILYSSGCSKCQDNSFLTKLSKKNNLMEKSVIIFSNFNTKDVVGSYINSFNINKKQIFIGDSQLNRLFDLSEDPTVYLNSNGEIIRIPKDKFLINLKKGK